MSPKAAAHLTYTRNTSSMPQAAAAHARPHRNPKHLLHAAEVFIYTARQHLMMENLYPFPGVTI